MRKCLSNLDIFYYLYTKETKFELKRYWNKISQDNDLLEAYLEALLSYEQYQVTSKEVIIIIKLLEFQSIDFYYFFTYLMILVICKHCFPCC